MILIIAQLHLKSVQLCSLHFIHNDSSKTNAFITTQEQMIGIEVIYRVAIINCSV